MSRSVLRPLITTLLGAGALLAPQSHARADIIVWANPMNGFFSDGSKWEGGSPPTENDTARFEEPAAYAVTFDADEAVDQISVTAGQVRFNLGGFTHEVLDPSDVGVRVGFLSTETASLLVRGGELLTPGATLGFLSGAEGTLDVAGSTALLTVTSRMVVGQGGTGTLKISSGGVVDFGPDLDVGTDVNSTGLIDLDGIDSLLFGAGAITLGQGGSSRSATLDMFGTPTVTAGSLDVRLSGLVKGSGFIDADVTNRGRIEPGTPLGAIEIDGSYTQTSSGALLVRPGGDTASLSRITVAGPVTLAGELVVDPTGSFLGSPGETFTIIEGASITGTFDTETITPFANDLSVAVVYQSDRVLLRVIDPNRLGDLNGDGLVSGADLAFLLGVWGSDDPVADLDNSGLVGPSDLAIILGNWFNP